MKLKRLEILGFKSFMDKVTLDFSEGISAVVGPNGCGKSNIVDAIRWVMGEQNARLLRGKKMEDVIFNGSEQAAPVSMAEVTLTLMNDGTGFPGNYSNSAEVSVTRRVFRDGESEYQINKVPCRLLDIREFFMDTGVGSRAYSLIEQNSVAGLVEAKPEDRRRYIEEAAGITKYKSRKEAAARKMESTRENLTRLNDIFREVKSQLNSISRQAKRAERYKALKQDLRKAELTVALQKYTALLMSEAELEQARKDLISKEDSIRAVLQKLEANLGEAKLDILTGNERVSACQERLYNLKTEINAKEQKLELSRVSLAQLEQQKGRLTAEISSLEEKQKQILEEISALNFSLENSAGDTSGLREMIAALQSSVEQLRSSEAEIYSLLESKKASHVHLLTEGARSRNMVASILKSLEDLKRRSEADEKELEETAKSIEASCRNAAAARGALEKDGELLEELLSREESISSRLDDLREVYHELGEIIQECREEMGSKSSRLLSLKELQDEFLWCQEGTRSIMKSYRERDFSCDGLYGLLADYIEVPSHYETAVESVLGEKLQYVITKSQEDGIKAIDYLKSKANGRGSFIPLEVRTNGSHSKSLPDGASRILDHVRVKSDVNGIAECLLGDVFLIPDLESAVGLWRKNGFEGTLVTPEGDIVNPHGILTGGRGGKSEAGLLKNKRGISELEREIKELSVRLNDAADRREQAKYDIAESEEQLKEIRAGVRELELKTGSSKKDLERFENEMKWLRQRESVLSFSRENLSREEAESSDRISDLKKQILEYEAGEQIAAAEIGELKTKWESVRRELDETERKLTDQKVLLASTEEKREAGIKALARLDAAAAQALLEIDKRKDEIVKGEAQAAEIALDSEREREAIREFYSRCALMEAELDTEKQKLSFKEEERSGKEQEIQETRKALDQVHSEAGEIELNIRETRYRASSLQGTISDKYSENLQELAPSFQPLSEEQMNETAEFLVKTRKSVEDYGEVNLLALTEFEQQKERHDFLQAQITDLNESLDALQRTIARINKVSRQRFAETFEAVNDCFKQVYPQLFPGGKGELRLTDESDMLETGVDIHLQVPGKRAQNITLLSGGEKAMAAVALIFSILIYRPTPFSILDEVDAALDDSNVNLFNTMLKNISDKTQVILITHNKTTMEVANNLYGVTMEKQGISKLVSVSLH